MKEIGLINREQALTAIEPKQAVSGPVTCMNAEKMHDRTTDELICRQDAIRIVDGIDTWQSGWRGNAIESMKALPSAQPEPEIYWGYTPTYERPLADMEIVSRLRDIQKQVGGSYAIDRAVEVIEAIAERRTDERTD